MNTLKERYELKQKNERLFETLVAKERFLEAILFIMTETEFTTLSQIACADWIEDELFLLTYVLTNDARSHNLMLKVHIGRDYESMPTLSTLFPQAEVMERDLHEMYGIGFEGNNTLYDFVLEDWKDLPPLRREFDTLAFVHEHFAFKGGRDDNKDVKVEQKRRRAEAKEKKALEEAKKKALDSEGSATEEPSAKKSNMKKPTDKEAKDGQ